MLGGGRGAGGVVRRETKDWRELDLFTPRPHINFGSSPRFELALCGAPPCGAQALLACRIGKLREIVAAAWAASLLRTAAVAPRGVRAAEKSPHKRQEVAFSEEKGKGRNE